MVLRDVIGVDAAEEQALEGRSFGVSQKRPHLVRRPGNTGKTGDQGVLERGHGVAGRQRGNPRV